MRSLTKLPEPQVLAENAATWLQEFLEDRASNTKRFRYRHGQIKATLKQETADKCVYCESRIGHNTPGDIEHKIPTSHDASLHFSWLNLTIACTECNRRKNSYYERDDGFLDPYVDVIDDFLDHDGPVVSPKVGQARAEVFVEVLELCSANRLALVAQKISKLNELRHVLERYNATNEGPLKEVLKRRLAQMAEPSAEYSAMVRSALLGKGYAELLAA